MKLVLPSFSNRDTIQEKVHWRNADQCCLLSKYSTTRNSGFHLWDKSVPSCGLWMPSSSFESLKTRQNYCNDIRSGENKKERKGLH